MAEPSSLDSILDDKAPSAPAEPAAPAAPPPPKEPPAKDSAAEAPEPEKSRRKEWQDRELNERAAGAGMVRDPTTGQFVKKAEAPAEAPKEPAKEPAKEAPQPPAQPEYTERERAFLRTAQEERRKRQELEQRLGQPQPPAKQPEQPKAFWDDPEGHFKAHEERMQQRETNLLLSTTERLARARYSDFDEKIAEFSALVPVTPGLAQQWLASPDPAEFAYSTGKNHLLLKQAGSLDAVTEKVRKETEAKVRADMEAEFKAKQEALVKERAALPGSLSDVRGAPANGSRPVFTGPTPLADILK